ncbi:hypothetical protein CGCF415_v006214 [Colletotrichum fructicola]|nr:hypothetical protein CGCF415_v006214 [Colletotrichum fructicola]KAF4937744.1 hypothetical protein CGCF245_v005215 [Colletotrichum fructicola]
MALLLSVIAFTTIFIILSAYNKQPQFDLSRGININTIIAILSTIVKATLVFVVAEVVGQSKWVWVESPQRLRDVEYFHEAGRGAWGSLKFLFKLWKPMTTALGAVVIVASFAIAPFSQQAATTYPCEIDVEGTASIDVAQWIGTGADGKMPVISSKTHVAAITGLIYGPSISAAGPTGFQCESGNCTFDAIGEVTHSSVGICSRCDKLVVRNETSESRTTFSINRTDENTKSPRPNITWPMSEGSDVFVMDSNQPPDSKESEREFETSFLSLKIVECTEGMSSYDKWSRHCGQSPGLTSNQDGQGFEIIGAKCRLYPCFRNYHGSILNGRLHEQEISSVKMNISGVQLRGAGASNITIYQHIVEPCIINGSRYDATNISAANLDNEWVVLNRTNGPVQIPRGCLRAMHFKAFSSISRGLSSTLHGTCFLKEVTRIKGDQPGGGGYDINCGEKWFLVHCSAKAI